MLLQNDPQAAEKSAAWASQQPGEEAPVRPVSVTSTGVHNCTGIKKQPLSPLPYPLWATDL